jgi:uncharacterized protein YecE (DUF72 family)
MLAYCAGHFSSVEVNSSFYRLPGVPQVERWREAVPPGFVFSVKASRYVTSALEWHDMKERGPFIGRRLPRGPSPCHRPGAGAALVTGEGGVLRWAKYW